MKRKLFRILQFGIAVILGTSLLASNVLGQHHGGGHHGGGRHGHRSNHHGFGGHYGGLGFHYSSYGHHSYYPHYDHYSGHYPSSYGHYGYVLGARSVVPYRGYAIAEAMPERVVVARPVIAASPTGGSSIATVGNSTSTSFNTFHHAAIEAFQGGRFNESVRLAKHAIVEDANGANLHLFLSHALFAAGEFQSAAAAIRHAAALESLEALGYYVKDWRAYYRGNQYTKAMNRLNRFIGSNPDDTSARFLRAYHFLYLEQTDYAAGELAKIIDRDPNDRLTRDLLARISAKEGGGSRQTVADTPPVLPQPDFKGGHVDDHAGHDH